MAPTTRRILTCLMIVFFIVGLQAINYPKPARCESDKNCLKGKAKCIRQQCHCTNKYAFGDGKHKCEKWEPCSVDKCTIKGGAGFKNSHCLASPSSPEKSSCKCDDGYYGRPNLPRCVRDNGADKTKGILACLTDKNCHPYSKCVHNRCSCLARNGDTCKLPKGCSSNKQCHAQHGMCFEGTCHCVGIHVGNGVSCKEAKPCPSNQQCPDSHAVCYMDPSLPGKATCRCDIREGFKRSKDGTRCIECSSDKDCKQAYATCYKGMCKCKDELIKDGKTCKPAPLHECKDDKDCDSRAKCEGEKCICQRNTTGNGKYCRDSLPCSPDSQCGSGGKCLVDPLFPKTAKCRCDKGYRHTKDGRCTECLSNKDCNTTYSTCDKGACKCKDELIKEGRSCKNAPLHLCDEEHKCHKKAKCHLGKCYCQGNSTGNGMFCRDSLPCIKKHNCSSHSHCVVDPLFPDKPECKCDLNSTKSADGKQCEEVTACFKKGLVCNNGTICAKDSTGSDNCVCPKGFEMASAGGNSTCQVIGDCKHTNTCQANSTCHNVKGSYQCICNQGYKMNAKKQCEPLGPSRESKLSRSRQHHPDARGTDVSSSSCTIGHVIILMLGMIWYQAFS